MVRSEGVRICCDFNGYVGEQQALVLLALKSALWPGPLKASPALSEVRLAHRPQLSPQVEARFVLRRIVRGLQGSRFATARGISLKAIPRPASGRGLNRGAVLTVPRTAALLAYRHCKSRKRARASLISRSAAWIMRAAVGFTSIRKFNADTTARRPDQTTAPADTILSHHELEPAPHTVPI